MRSAFNPQNYVLTASLDSSKDTIDYGYDVPNLSKYLDYMLLWSFDFSGMWSRFIGHNAPLYSNNVLSVVSSINKTNINILSWIYFNKIYFIDFVHILQEYATMYLLKLGADSRKLLMGISSSGRAFIALDVIDMSVKLPGLGTKFKNYTFSGPYTEEDTGFLGYNEVWCIFFYRKIR